MKPDKISIVVPVYNAEKYLTECIDSILNQTYTVDEIILVDDGSTDKSSVICDEYSQRYSNIKVIHKNNGGAASARNVGLDNFSGDYISFIDCDDVLHPQNIEILYKLIKEEDADISMSYYDFFDKQPNKSLFADDELTPTILSGKRLLDEYLEHYRKVSLISLCMKLYKKDVFNDLRIPEGYIEEDSMSLPYILERANKIIKTDLKLYHWRNTPGSVTRSGFNPKQFAHIQICYSNIEFFTQRDMKAQADYFKKESMHRTLKYYYKIPIGNKDLLDAFKPYMKKFRRNFFKFWFAKGLCIRERIAYLFFLISPKIAEKIYNQVYGGE